MQLGHLKSFGELGGLSERLNRQFKYLESHPTTDEEPMTAADWYPPVDVMETEDAFYLKVELPEVNKSDVRVSIDDGVLIIRGERKKKQEENGPKIHRLERPYGRFYRSFTLPESIAIEKVKAEVREGMLYLHLPKLDRATARAIEVKAA